MNAEQVRELADALGLKPSDVVVEAKVKDFESGASGVSVGVTDDVEWVSQLGMLRAAEIITMRDIERHGGPDE
ncbi:MAG: hypothetical protein ACRDTT_25565 [Pseudonocardiaceae bacterium]